MFQKPVTRVNANGVNTSNIIEEYSKSKHPDTNFKPVVLTREVDHFFERLMYWVVTTAESGTISATPVTKPRTIKEKQTRFDSMYINEQSRLNSKVKLLLLAIIKDCQPAVDSIEGVSIEDALTLLQSATTLRANSNAKAYKLIHPWCYEIDINTLFLAEQTLLEYKAVCTLVRDAFINDTTGKTNYSANIKAWIRSKAMQ